MLVLILLIAIATSSNLYCADSVCSSCTSGYLYNTYSCLPLCPTGFTQSSNQCTASSSLSVFYLNFWDFGNYAATSIGSFNHPSGLSFSDSGQGSPIPTKERGFYFASTSRLKSTANWIFAPDFTLRLAIKIINDGVVFITRISDTVYTEIAASAGLLAANWYLTSNSSPSTLTTASHSMSFTYSSWFLLILSTSQSSGSFTITMNGVSTTTSGFEFRGQITPMKFYIGSSVSGISFTGFFDEIIANNTVISTYTRKTPYIDCLFNYFYDVNTATCTQCTGCTTTWPWCARADCTTCVSPSCSACTGYFYSQCTACNNGGTAPGCSAGKNCAAWTSTYSCTSCVSTFTLIDGLCIYSPYAYNPAALSTPVFDINFETFSQYYGGVFQSGANAATYAPYNSPEADDPYPVKSRGMYFNGAGYLVSNTNIAMNYKSTIALWLYPRNAEFPWFSQFYRLAGLNYGLFVLSSPEATWALYTFDYVYNYDVWQFNAYTIDFISDTTLITQTVGTSVTNAMTADGYAFYDTISQVWIAQLSTYTAYNYLGFIYSITVWQTAIYDFSSEYNVCGSGEAAACLWSCGVTQYYNAFDNSCQNCETCCSSGCGAWGTCNQCKYASCSSCSDFNGTCTAGASECVSGFTLSSTGKCCNSACADCYGPGFDNCIACSGSYLLGQLCVNSCPLGYTAGTNVCTSSTDPFLVLTLSQILDVVHDSVSNIAFSTGSDTSFYPTGLDSDPVPAMQRGYYFAGASFMTSAAIYIPYNFTMVFLIKHMNIGCLLAKNTITICTSNFVTFSILSEISAVFTEIVTTDWVGIGFSVSTCSTGITTVKFQYNTGEAYLLSGYNYIYQDTSSAIVLGDSVNSFVGFIWEFSIYNTVFDVTTMDFTMCVDSSEASCLWNCDIDLYLSGSSYNLCSFSCTGGCRQGLTCNLCDNMECLLCTGFTATSCTACISESSLVVSTCVCDSNYYWDSFSSSCLACPSNTFSSSEICVNCYSACLTCSGSLSTNCLTCIPDASLQSDNSCLCNTGYYLTGATCSACSAFCTTCSGPNSDDCTSCPSNAQVAVSGACQCNPSYYLIGTTCSACATTCNTCSGPAFNQCLTCLSNAALQIGNSCTCNLYYYWDSTQCASCDATCATCTGPTSTQCSSCLSNAGLTVHNSCLCDVSYTWSGSQCIQCDPTCSQCTGTYANQCTSCASGLTLQGDSTCSCDLQTYWDSDSASCEACQSTCEYCTGPGSDQCTACADPEASLTDGVCNCNSGWYWESNSLMCSVCDSKCVQCTGPMDSDCICTGNSVKVGDICVCTAGLFMDGNVCAACDSRCLSCSGGTYYQCLSCTGLLLGSVCLSTCPVGYSPSGNECIKFNESVPNVEYIFNTIEGIYYDSYSNLPAITGINPSGYPNIDSTDPIPAYQRGLYFTGDGSYLAVPYQPSGILLLGIKFFISAWLNPITLNGILFSKSENHIPLFSVTIINGYLSVIILINENTYEYESIYPLGSGQWNYALISVDYDQGASISILTNTLSSSPLMLTSAAFIDTVGLPLYVGTSGTSDDYNGFIYSIGIYSSYPTAETPISQCNQCNLCQPSGICLPVCNITSFYADSILQCIECPQNCVNGCRNSENCNMCNDIHCISCSTYDSNSCIICSSGYEVQNQVCVACNSTSYYNTDIKSCTNCTGLCENCNSTVFCTKCIENSSLMPNNSCSCDKGYTEADTCIRNVFTATIGINSNNQAALHFSEALNNTLEASDITVKLNENAQDYQISEEDSATYSVKVSFNTSISSGDTLNIIFLSPPVSVDNSILITSSLTANLFAQSYNDLVSQISTMRSYSQTGVTVGLSSALGVSALNLNPTIFFNFLNSAEIYSYIVLYDLDLDPSLIAFLNELQVTSQMPNMFSYFINPNNGVQFTGKFSNFGYNNNLVMLNCGNNITLVCIFIALMLSIMLASIVKCMWLNNQLTKVMGYFKYGAFLRLWIQTFLPTILSALLSILFTDLGNKVQLADIIISCIILVISKQIIEAYCICLLIWVILKRKSIIDPDEKERFLKIYATFFDEFKDEGLSSWIFYLIFVFRRLSLGMIILFISNPLLQLTLSVSFTLFVMFMQIPAYIFATKAYKETITGFYIALNEVLTCIYYFVISLPYISNLQLTKQKTATICIGIILTALLLNIGSSMLITINNIRNWLKKRRDTRKSRIGVVESKDEFTGNSNMHRSSATKIAIETQDLEDA